jgi:predicted  nucleic acid-binding Zn-ribbon protein
MIQAIMLIALGFLAASLIGVLLAPSLWNRASRLSKKKLESTLPLTLAEIEAAQDQLRASYAVRLRRLETALASAKQKAANQLVDNSRLQMQIAALKDRIGDLDLKLSERRNAATVLEQTIAKRFPELDREIASVKTQLQERSFELQDLTNRLARRDEELAAAQRAAASYQDEIDRLRGAMEKGAGDRSGRRVRKASQWNLEDYKAEYDRLNLEMSKLRQQLAHFQDRDAQQVGVIKGELQKLAELILASAPPKASARPPEQRPEVFTRRPSSGYELRKDRPAPWLQDGSPMPLTARLKLTAEAAETGSPSPPSAASIRDRPSEGETAPIPLSSVLSILPEETVLTSAPKNGPVDAGPRTKILQGVVTPEAVETERPADARESAEPFAETIALIAEQAAAVPHEDAQSSDGEVSATDVKASEETVEETTAPPMTQPAPQQDAESHGGEAEATEAKALDGVALTAKAGEAGPAPEIEKAAVTEAPAEGEAPAEQGHAAAKPAAANGHGAEKRDPGAAPDLTESLGIDNLTADLEPEEKAAAQPSSLLERLRAAEDAAEAKH